MACGARGSRDAAHASVRYLRQSPRQHEGHGGGRRDGRDCRGGASSRLLPAAAPAPCRTARRRAADRCRPTSIRRSSVSSSSIAGSRSSLLLVLTLASFPFLYVSLDLPKTIINHAIREDAKFPQYHSRLRIRARSLPAWCCAAPFSRLVLVNGAFKYCINTFKGQLGERMLRRFRYQLYLRLLRFPLTLFPARPRRRRSSRW